MGRLLRIAACLTLLWSPGSSPWSPGSSDPGQANPGSRDPGLQQVIFETELGSFTVEVDLARAPITSANFLKYVEGKFYDGGMANRAVRPDNTTRKDIEIQVVQFQSDPARGKELFPAIPLERTSVTGLKHLDGTLSMARGGADTATSSFFICIGDQPSLDFGGKRNDDGQGFAAFGRVVTGMDVVRKIHASKTRAPGGRGAYGTEGLEPVILVVKAYRK
jgi:peptidyl-prolyl cis-trans isomerase A (cyclophilin A)